MKFSSASLSSALVVIALTTCSVLPIGSVSAAPGTPRLSINVREGNFDGLNSFLDPTLTWSTEGEALDGTFDYEIGFDLPLRGGGGGDAKDDKDVPELLSYPRSAYGKISRDDAVMGWDLSARADLSTGKSSGCDVDLRAARTRWGLGLKVLATAWRDGIDCTLNRAELSKGFNVPGGRLVVSPRYDRAAEGSSSSSSRGDVVVSYDAGGTGLRVVASPDGTGEITVSQNVMGPDNVLSPSITTGGDMSLRWDRDLKDGGSLTTTVAPGDSVGVKWTDGPWVADVNAPLEGFFSPGEVKVSVRRKVDFL